MKKQHIALGVTRIALGWIFLWGFLDKLFGLGFATQADKAWLAGGSPTFGFLKFATKGPFAEIFSSLAGNPVVDWLFMLGLLGIGIALVLGIAMKAATCAGILLLMLMYVAGFLPPEHNPIVDDHIMYSLLLFVLYHHNAGDYLGIGKTWRKTALVKRLPWLA